MVLITDWYCEPKFMGMQLNAHAARIISDYDMFRTALFRYYAESGEFPRDRYPGGVVPE